MGTVKKSSVTVNPNLPDCKLRYKIGNLQGIGARMCQEDSFTFINALDEKKYDISGLMFAVCDGMGGMKNGQLASSNAIASLRTSFTDMDRRGLIPTQLKEAVISASDSIERLLNGEGGSTAVVCIVFHEKLYFASVGDSYLYLYRDGSLCRLNSEHTVCRNLYLKNIKNGSTETQSCRDASEASALTSYLGVPDLTEVDITVRPLNLRKGDVILSCSDGVGGVVDENELTEALTWAEPQDICNRLEKYIQEHANPNQDNYTALILRCL